MNPEPTTFHTETARRPEGRFYIGMSLAALAIALAGFGPAAMGSGRREPITLVVAAHGLVFLAWLALFITQTVLISNRQLGMHRRLGYAGVVLAMLMVVSGYETAVAMARRGYDLSGDLIRGAGDPLELLVFQLGDLVSFSLLVGLAVWYRRELQVNKTAHAVCNGRRSVACRADTHHRALGGFARNQSAHHPRAAGSAPFCRSGARSPIAGAHSPGFTVGCGLHVHLGQCASCGHWAEQGLARVCRMADSVITPSPNIRSSERAPRGADLFLFGEPS